MSEQPLSPQWSTQTKTIVVTSLLVVAAFLLVRFQGVIPPILMSIILAYLLHPLAYLMEKRLRLPWGLAVAVIFLVLGAVTIGLLTLGGLELLDQFQKSLALVQTVLDQIPNMVNELPLDGLPPGMVRDFLESADLGRLLGEVVGVVEPTVGRAGSLLGAVASGAFSTLGWTLFIFLVSYFLLVESGGLKLSIFKLDLRDYNEDARHLGQKLSRIWNAFLRGQLIIVALAMGVYTLVLSVYGIHYALGLALLAGLARFLPYVGPAMFWVIVGLVAYFQDYKLFDMSALGYALLVVATSMIIDYVVDNVVYARVMADTLNVHPAAILVSVVIAADLLGLLGVLIAAPIMATLQLLLSYTIRKLFNEDPWPPADDAPQPVALRIQVQSWLKHLPARRKTG